MEIQKPMSTAFQKAQRHYEAMEDPLLSEDDEMLPQPAALLEIRACNEHAQNLINYRAVKRMNELDKPKTFRGRGRRKAAKGLPIGRTLSGEIHRG